MLCNILVFARPCVDLTSMETFCLAIAFSTSLYMSVLCIPSPQNIVKAYNKQNVVVYIFIDEPQTKSATSRDFLVYYNISPRTTVRRNRRMATNSIC